MQERRLDRFSTTPPVPCKSGPRFTGISISVLPIVRMSVQMHYCKDKNLVLLNTIDNAIGEPVYKTAPHVLFYDWPGGGVVDNILDGVKDLDCKIVTKAVFTIFIVIDSLKEL
jgi:hypothetical protein